MILNKLVLFYKNPKNIIASLLLLGFFLPWISYGYISKSAFSIPFSPQDIENILKFVSMFKPQLAEQISMPKELIYLYALYLFPLLVTFLFFLSSRIFSIGVALIPLLPFTLAYQLLPFDITKYIGFGLVLTLIASVALIIESLFRRKV